ncbi:MAG TPA: hypothetical protein VIH21_03945, partial [Dehalococcoidia bacterium]
MRSTSSWLLSLALAALVATVGIGDLAAQQRPTQQDRRTTPPPTTAGPGGLPSTVTAAPVAAKVYALPTITYGAPMPPQQTSKQFDARIARFETVSVAANVNGRSVNRQLVVLNGHDGIEASGIDEGAKRLLAMHVRKLNLNESTVYFFDPQVAAEWFATHDRSAIPKEQDDNDDDDGGSGCGFQNPGNCVSDPGGALQDAADATVAEFERARDRAQDWWDDSADKLADAWNEAKNCFSDNVLPGGTVPVKFGITPNVTVDLSQSGTKGASSGSATGSVGLGIPMDGDLQAKVDFFYIPCLPFVVRPRSITVTGDLTVGEELAITAAASGAFNKTYTIPPTGGPRIPIQVIPIVIGGVPVAVIDVSAYIEGTVEVAAKGSVDGKFTLSNEHRSTFDFTCDGHGCKNGSGRRPTTSTPITTTESVQVEGKVSAKPGLYTALMLTLNVNVLGARVGPVPYLLGTAMGCGAATATQTNGGDSTGAQNAALAADLDWGVDIRAEALVAGKVMPNRYYEEITGDRHIWFKDLVPGGSSALRAALAGPTEAATGQAAAYKLRMPTCYPYDAKAKYRVTWTGNATPSSAPANACEWQAGRGDCSFDPTRDLDLRFAWPAEGSYALTAALLGDEHQTFDPKLPAAEMTIAVTGAPAPGGTSTGGAGGASGGSGQRDGGSTGSSGGRPGPVTSSTSSGSHDIVPNPAMRGRLGRLVVAYPEKVAARIDVFRPGEPQAVATGYGDQSFDLLPGTYEVSISGKRIAGVAV